MELEDLLNEFGLEQYEKSMDILFPQTSFSFEEIWKKVVAGDVLDALWYVVQSVMGGWKDGLGGVKNVFLWLIILGVAGALFMHFVEIFDKSQVADLCFYFVYLMVSAVMFQVFREIFEVAEETLENIVLFVKLLAPTYLVSVGVSSGTATVALYYEMVILMVYGVESVLLKIVLPLIACHMLLAVINGIWPRERLALLIDLFGKIIVWILKAGVGLVTGLSVFQAMITPALDSVENAAVRKMIAAIPGVGDAAEGVIDITYASAMVVKNSIGVVLLILLFGMCLMPLVRIFVMAFCLKCAAALMGIVSDKRICACANHAADALFLLLKTTGAAMLLFMVSLSVVAVSTNKPI